mgnify:FL=1|tara:strand:- start:10476 stop:11351 length:876 start_codon:yes stop_codon:yes gene_type:complete
MDIQCLTDQRAVLGESPLWAPDEGAVYWIDIRGHKLLRTTLSGPATQTWNLPSPPGMIAHRRQGGLVIALQDGLYAFEADTGDLRHLMSLEADMPDNRANDGKPDVAGRLWLGTMNADDETIPSGKFYRITPSLDVTAVAHGIRIPNGLAWSPDNKTMYRTDTAANVVHAYDFDAVTGEISGKRDFFHFDGARTGGVDGAAVDSAGGYWTTLYGGGKVIRVTPDGHLDIEITLPVTQPTMPVFGGEDMQTLFITSARQNLSDKDLQATPLAGALFALRVPYQGQLTHPFDG